MTHFTFHTVIWHIVKQEYWYPIFGVSTFKIFQCKIFELAVISMINHLLYYNMQCHVLMSSWSSACATYRSFVHQRKWVMSVLPPVMAAGPLFGQCFHHASQLPDWSFSVSSTGKRVERPWPELTSCFCCDPFRNVDEWINICSKFLFLPILMKTSAPFGHLWILGDALKQKLL